MMTKSYKNSLNKIAVFMMSAVFSASAFSLTELTEDEMGDISGQASLIGIDRYDFEGNNFYRVQLDSVIDTSVNVDSLVLRDNLGNAQIDVDNFSLSGGMDGQVSSATITNPFVEFAFAGDIDDSTARNREIIGIRIGADNIDGTLSFGDPQNLAAVTGSAATEDGLNAFRGYLRTTPINGTVFIKPETRAIEVNTTLDVQLVGRISVTGEAFVPLLDLSKPPEDQRISLTFQNTFGAVLDSSQPTQLLSGGNGQASNNGVFTQAFVLADVNATTIGQLQSVDNAMFDSFVNVGAAQGSCNFLCQLAAGAIGLFNPFSPEITVNNTRVSGPLPGDDDPLSLFVNESTRLIHRVDTQSSGFFISAQNTDVIWRNDGASPSGRAQSLTTAGWWLEFLDPVDLGELVVQDFVLPDNVIEGIGAAVNQNIADQPAIDAFSALGSLFNFPVSGVSANLIPDVNPGITGFGNFNVVDRDIPLASSVPIVNCFNSSIGC